MFSQVLLSLFYFLDLLPEPGKLPAGIDFFRYIGNLVAHHVFDSILVNPIALGHGDKVGTAVVRTVIGVQLQLVSDALEGFLIPGIRQLEVFPVAVIGVGPVEQIGAAQCLRLLIFSEHQVLNAGVDGDDAVLASVRLHAALEGPVLQVHIFQFQ